MAYLGLPLSLGETLRILGFPPESKQTILDTFHQRKEQELEEIKKLPYQEQKDAREKHCRTGGYSIYNGEHYCHDGSSCCSHYLNDYYFVEKGVSLGLYYLGKGLYVLGYKLEELEEVHNPHKFIPFSRYMEQLQYYRNAFANDLATLGADTSRIKLSGKEYTDDEDVAEFNKYQEENKPEPQGYVWGMDRSDGPPRYVDNAEPFMFVWG